MTFKFSNFWFSGGRGAERCVSIVGFKVSCALLLPYLAFFVGIGCKTGVWVALSVCLLLFVGACQKLENLKVIP
jgi:uncharacterized membrane protein YqaE (UPF0057 family)